MKIQRQTFAIVIGLTLLIGWFVFSGPDRWNLGRVILGIGMSIAGVINLIRNPKSMNRLIIGIFFVPLLTALVYFEAKNPSAGWPLATAWSMILLGLLLVYASMSEAAEGGSSDAGNQNAQQGVGGNGGQAR